MAKGFTGIATAADLGKNNLLEISFSNDGISTNNQAVLYAENINSVVYNNANLTQSQHIPQTKKYVSPIVSSPTVNYNQLNCPQAVKYVDIQNSSVFENSIDDWIIMHLDYFAGDNYAEMIEYAEATAGSDDMQEMGYGCKAYVCNPALDEYKMEWNGETYYVWKLCGGDEVVDEGSSDEGTWVSYFLTSIADYDVLKSMSMTFYGNTDGWSNANGRLFTHLTDINNILIAAFNTDDNILTYNEIDLRWKNYLRIADVTHFQGLYFKFEQNSGSLPPSYAIDLYVDNDNTNPNVNISYSIDFGLTWQSWAYRSVSISSSNIPNNIIFFKGNNPNGFNLSTTQYCRFRIIKSQSSGLYTMFARGNIMSLIDNGSCTTTTIPNDYCFYSLFSSLLDLASTPDLPATVLKPYCYRAMFSSCRGLISIPTLPATTLASNCYYEMFSGCVSLVTAPELPATTLASNCYYEMFKDCSALISAPELPATTLANNCYDGMFQNCTSLVTAPELPSISLSDSCYKSMFKDCSALISAPELPATTLANNCYDGMFQNCTSLVTAPELPAPIVTNWCYAHMFKGCTSLIKLPELISPTVSEDCYYEMAYGCYSLTSAPDLPATSLSTDCYRGMFRDCSALTNAPVLPAVTLSSGCYREMFKGCKSLTKSPILPASTLTGYCYNSMFEDCTKLNEIVCYATSNIDTNYSTTNWVKNVASSGTLYSQPTFTWAVSSYNRLPSGWSCLEDYFTIHMGGGGTSGSLTATVVVRSSNHSLYYKKYNQSTWTQCPVGTTAITLSMNEDDGYIQFRGTLSGGLSTSAKTTITISTSMSARWAILYGSLNSIWNYFNLNESLKNYCGYGLFEGSTAVMHSKDVEYTNLRLHSNTLFSYAYACMFKNCENLNSTPDLPAYNLSNYCYSEMFSGCKWLTNVTRLPAKTLQIGCYYSMFKNCIYLISAPLLPARQLKQLCYYEMFSGCSELKNVICYAMSPYIDGAFSGTLCTTNWLNGVNSTGSFTTHEDTLPFVFEIGSSGIPSTWTISTDQINKCFCINIQFSAVDEFLTLQCNNLASNQYLKYCICTGPSTLSSTRGMYQFDDIEENDTITVDPSHEQTPFIIRTFRIYIFGLLTDDNQNNNYTNLQISGTYVRGTIIAFKGNINSIWNSTDLQESLYEYCGYKLFANSDAPINITNLSLPSKHVSAYGYAEMFKNCTMLSVSEQPTLPAISVDEGSYMRMFSGCERLITAPELPAKIVYDVTYYEMFRGCYRLTTCPSILPSISLSDSCYKSMFKDCSALTNSPTLPATVMCEDCYYSMFEGCINLINAPALPSRTLESYCYQYMFKDCTKLEVAPELPATQLEDNCYYSMFEGCSKLTTAPILVAYTLSGESCYEDMFKNCTSLHEIITYAVYEGGNNSNWLNGTTGGTVYCKNVSGTTVPAGWTKVQF